MKRTTQSLAALTMAILSTIFVATTNASTPATANMAVTTAVLDHCIVTANPLSVGTYDPIVTNASSGVDLQGNTTLSVACLTGLHAWIGLSQGSNPNTGSTDTVPLRQMLYGTNKLGYELYQDAGLTTLWGNVQPSSSSYSGTGLYTTVTVYGKVDKGQNVPSGNYSDLLIVSVNF
jgi:spore coat protein U-like protein